MFEFIEPEETEQQSFEFIDPPVSGNSEKEEDKLALSATLAESNIRGSQDADIELLFNSNKEALKNGQEDSIRDNIATMEQQGTLEATANLFDEAVSNGDVNTAKGAVALGQESSNILFPDAIEFNALDTFRQDRPEADSETMDNTQAVLAASMIANNKMDKEVEQGVFDKVNEFYTNLQTSANENGNSLKQDIAKGIVNGVPTMLEGIADNINKLLPDAYWNAISEDGDGKALRDSVLNRVADETLPQFDTGVAGDATATMTALGLGMVALATKIPALAVATKSGAGTLSLNAMRLTATGTIADVAILDSADSLSKTLIEFAPSTEVPLTKYLADRNPDSEWENKLKQAIEATAIGGVFEGAASTVIGLFRGVKKLKQGKADTAVMQAVAKDPIQLMEIQGNKDTAASIALQKLESSTTLARQIDNTIDVEDAVKAVLPNSMKTPIEPKLTVGLTGRVSSAEARQRFDEVLLGIEQEVLSTPRLNADELESVIAKEKERITGLYASNTVADINITKERGVNVAEVYIGKQDGSGYKTEAAAMNQTEGMNVEIVKNESGEFYAVHKRVLRETGGQQPITFDDTSILAKNAITRNIIEPADFLPDHLLQDIGIASNARSRTKKELLNPAIKRYRTNVNSQTFQHVNDIAAIGRDTVIDKQGRTGKWFSQEEFESQYTRINGSDKHMDKAWDSYSAYRDINDLQYLTENNNEYIRKATMGFEEINITTEKFDSIGNGIIKESFDVSDTYRVYSASDDKMFDKGQLRRENLFDHYKDSRIIELEEPKEIETGEVVKYVMVDKSDFKANALDPFQVSYREGGRVVYAGKYFIKQANTKTNPNGETINLTPLTSHTAVSKQELVAHASKLENARNAYKAITELTEEGGSVGYREVKSVNKDGTFTYGEPVNLTPEQADAIISKTSLVDIENMRTTVESGGINLEHPFEVRGDGELPLAYGSGNTSYIPENYSGATSWLSSSKRKKFSGRGDRLLSPQETAAKVLDPNETAERAVQSIINNGMVGNYTTRISNQFTATAKAMGYLKPEFQNASPARIFSAGRDAIQPNPVLGAADPEYQGLITTLEAMQRGLGFKGAASRMKDAQVQKFAEYMDSKGMGLQAPEYDKNGNVIQSKRGKFVVALNDANPLQKMNNVLYTTQFGLDAAQFFLQGIGGSAMTVLQSPQKALQAMAGAPMYATHFLDPKITSSLRHNKTVMNLLGWKNGDEFESFVKHMDKSGYIDVHNTHIDLARQKAATGKSGVAFDLIDKAISKSTVAMETGEMLNQVVAYKTAYLRYRDLYPKADINSAQSTGWIIREADKLTFNMKSAVQSTISKNPVTAVPLRFKNYFIRVFQANTVGTKRSAAEKATFWGASTLMFGLGTNSYTEWLKGKLDITDQKTIQGIDNGLVNYMLTDKDGNSNIDVSNTIDPRGIKDFYDTLTSEDSKLLEVAGGALLAKGKTIKDKSMNALNLLYEIKYQPKQAAPLAFEAMKELSMISSGMSKSSRGYHAFQTGTLYSSKNTPLVDNMSNAAALTTMFGFRTTQELQAYANVGVMIDQSKTIKETADSIFYIIQQAEKQDRTTAGGEAKYQMYTTIADRLSNVPLHDDIMKRVEKKQYFSETPSLDTGRERLEERRETIREFNEE